MRSHIPIVAWLHIISGGFFLLIGLFVFIACVVLGLFALPTLPFVGAAGALVLLVIAVFSLPSVIIGWGLLQNAEWARVLAIVLALIGLVFHPLSWTGIGVLMNIYFLVVLFNSDVVAMFQRNALRSE